MIDAVRALLADPEVQSGIRQAWVDSNPGPTGGHEEGGFIVRDAAGKHRVVRWPAGAQTSLLVPAHDGCRQEGDSIIATFHTHPNTGRDYHQGPSDKDLDMMRQDHHLLAPWYLGEFVVSKKRIYWITPKCRVRRLGATATLLER
jgi:hypothetical protein